MLACLDGIAGVGKSTLLSWLERRALSSGISTCRLHFFSDIAKLRVPSYEDPAILEHELLNADVDSQYRADLFRQLCSLACDAFLSASDSWPASLMLFDRSPLSYYAYCEGALGIPVKLWTELENTVAVLRPIVLVGDVLEAHRRIRLRDGSRTKSIFHRLSIDEEGRVQEKFKTIARSLGVVCCNSYFARRHLMSALQSEIDNA